MSAGPHLTREEISEAVERLLPEARQRSAEAHLAGCEECRSSRDEIAEVRTWLRGIGEHRPAMPDQVADRLLTALSAEARRPRSVSAAPAAGEPAGTGRTGVETAGAGGAVRLAPVPDARPRRRVGRARMARAAGALAAAAAVAAVAVGGTLGYQQLVAGRSPSTTASDPERSSAAPQDSGERSPAPGTPVYAIMGAPELTSQRFRDDVTKAVRPGSKAPEPSQPGRGPEPMTMMGDCPGNTVAKAGGGVVLDQANATFDGGPADLVITRSQVSGAVEAYVVTGCPKTGVVAHHQTIRLSR